MKLLVGTSGYNYKHWGDGVFYPPELSQRNWLEYYAEHFNTVELNVTFYRLPQTSAFLSWEKRTPADFKFALKGSRFITHIKRLKECEDSLSLFFTRANELKEKLEVVLWQLPPGLKKNMERLEHFCQLISENKEAKEVRHAFEFRHHSWFSDDVYSLLQKNNFSLCIAHSNRWPYREVVTADFVYLRFHGGEVLYSSNYSEEELSDWAKKAGKWLGEGRDVYAYFNNDAYGYALFNALRFRELVESEGEK